ncbi:MAG TPA: histidinol-phosphate transaminase [Burkholderiales bacterium]|jgi:histidinol-phosphate aminotransferase|nr:histidinol-phosphate transaminase [Burkholderiales bacterium]
MSSNAPKVVRPEIQTMHAYPVADATGLVKLDLMESPYGLPPGLAAEVGRVVAGLALNRYPIPTAEKLRGLIKEVMQVPAGCEVLLGNGSDECIQYITATLAREGAAVMAPSPSFAIFAAQALFYRLRFVGVPLREDFTLDGDAFLAAMAKEKPALVWIAYPNNPTGNAFPVADIERILRAAPGLVVIDEAYQPFAGGTFMPRLAEFENLAVMRTVSKIGMAGLRLGYVCARPEWIGEFNKARSPFNINVITEAVAVKLLENKKVLDEQAGKVLAERERIRPELERLPGITIYPSVANFFLARVQGPAGSGTRVFESLKAQGVLVRNFDGGLPALQNCLRLTVGSPEENRILIAGLREALKT